MKIRVLINGAPGKMGRVAISVLESLTEFTCVAQCGRADDLSTKISQHKPQVVIDLTSADCVYVNTQTILSHGVRPIIGSSGLTQSQVTQLQDIAKLHRVGGIIAPNFSLGALLMMRFSKMAARYFPQAEIIEMHHQQKKDAPSGTARLTAELIDQQGLKLQPSTSTSGFKVGSVAIHSLRLAGVLARQQVIFSGPGETLTFDHNTQNYEVYRAGIALACEKVMKLDHLIYGLDQLLE